MLIHNYMKIVHVRNNSIVIIDDRLLSACIHVSNAFSIKICVKTDACDCLCIFFTMNKLY